jgi:ankyrin repeat protein
LIDILLNSGADPTLKTKTQLSVLHMAAQGDKPYSLMLFKQMFVNIRADINTRDSEMSTPLHWACFCNSHKIINFLISLGADVNARDVKGETPLHIAVKKLDWKDPKKSLIIIQRLY